MVETSAWPRRSWNVLLWRAEGVPTLTFRHCSVEGKVLNGDVIRTKREPEFFREAARRCGALISLDVRMARV